MKKTFFIFLFFCACQHVAEPQENIVDENIIIDCDTEMQLPNDECISGRIKTYVDITDQCQLIYEWIDCKLGCTIFENTHDHCNVILE